MGIYSTNESTMSIEAELKNPNQLLEAYIFDELSSMSDEDKQQFVNSNEAKSMMEAGLITKKTLVRLTKQDDLSRRMTMACFQMAKEADDPLWDQLVKNRVKERDLINKIKRKYQSKAQRVAKVGQKSYLKQKMPLSLMKPTRF